MALVFLSLIPGAASAQWTQLPGPQGTTLKQIAVSSASTIYGLDTGGVLYKWNGVGWDRKGCCVSTISVGSDGELWATNPPDSMRVLRWNGSQWTWNMPTGMKQVTVANASTIYGLDNGGKLFRWNGSAWDQKGCCVSQVSVGGDGELWATNPPDSLRVLKWNGAKWTWSIPTGMTYVAVGNARNVWALNGADQIFKWSGSAWSQVPGALRNISVGNDGTVVGVNSTGGIYRYNGSGGAPALPDQATIEALFPRNVRFAAGENCQAPASKDQKTGVALYYVGPHPRNPDRVLASFALLFRQDCGHAGHSGAHGAESHPGDAEYFYYTLKQDASCSKGWRIHAMKTVAHSGDYKRREINERILDSCDPPGEVVSSLGKHAVYLSWLDCTKRTPAEVCLNSFSAGYNLYNIGTGPGQGPNLAQLMAQNGQSNGQDKVWPADGDGRFCGGQVVGNRADCVGAPGDKMARKAGWQGDEWELPDPDLGGSHSCPYGLENSAGLCYKGCDPGYSGHATMCIPGCPSGFRDDGLYCFKPNSYGRGAGYPWKFGDSLNDSGMYRRCENDHGAGNCEKNGAIVYPKCKQNFHAVGCCVCSPDCPSRTTDIGISCQKHTYDRGVGCLP
ncbi:hypothetical protein POL68_20115 [Stigmatella sp. ncwal1]|uniref:Uncharacterized protein n=1 Tax=Stigmatella ashevillensis TaxID=2995309 RepID=A0ABT5DDD4_9BACT|nr:tectonin domain-containing protein [Stigmatella ashevillena]MDC0710793.1 hypothetical protein [Stigmatella ashevillena]